MISIAKDINEIKASALETFNNQENSKETLEITNETFKKLQRDNLKLRMEVSSAKEKLLFAEKETAKRDETIRKLKVRSEQDGQVILKLEKQLAITEKKAQDNLENSVIKRNQDRLIAENRKLKAFVEEVQEIAATSQALNGRFSSNMENLMKLLEENGSCVNEVEEIKEIIREFTEVKEKEWQLMANELRRQLRISEGKKDKEIKSNASVLSEAKSLISKEVSKSISNISYFFAKEADKLSKVDVSLKEKIEKGLR